MSILKDPVLVTWNGMSAVISRACFIEHIKSCNLPFKAYKNIYTVFGQEEIIELEVETLH